MTFDIRAQQIWRCIDRYGEGLVVVLRVDAYTVKVAPCDRVGNATGKAFRSVRQRFHDGRATNIGGYVPLPTTEDVET